MDQNHPQTGCLLNILCWLWRHLDEPDKIFDFLIILNSTWVYTNFLHICYVEDNISKIKPYVYYFICRCSVKAIEKDRAALKNNGMFLLSNKGDDIRIDATRTNINLKFPQFLIDKNPKSVTSGKAGGLPWLISNFKCWGAWLVRRESLGISRYS